MKSKIKTGYSCILSSGVSVYYIDVREFVLIPPRQIGDWWLESKLPHPGCPTSFSMVVALVWACHFLPEEFRENRATAIKHLIGNVRRLPEPERFYFPYKDKTLIVPMDNVCMTDMSLLDLILEHKI